MEIVIDHEEINRLLRAALQTEGVVVPDGAEMVVRQNHKTSTIRIVFLTRRDGRGREKPA